MTKAANVVLDDALRLRESERAELVAKALVQSDTPCYALMSL